MGLAGRDPVFFSQLQGETNHLSQLTTCIENTCLHCHAVMGQRQLAIDTKGQGGRVQRYVRHSAAAGGAVRHTFAAKCSAAMARVVTVRPTGLWRIGTRWVSCAVCHHIAQKDLGQERAFTGNFVTGKPKEVYGPYNNNTIVPKPMQRALGLTPKFGQQISSSELCGSCHDILLPIFSSSGQRLGASYEQSTHLEWLNSDSGRPGPKFQSCQSCHMPTQYKGNELKFKIANSESFDQFPPTTHRLPDKDIELTERGKFYRHSLHGLNGFLNQFFQQFPLLLGFNRQTGCQSNLRPSIRRLRRSVQTSPWNFHCSPASNR